MSPAATAGPVVHRLGGTTMGTCWAVSIVAPECALLPPLHATVAQTLDAVDREMSHWRADSDLMRYCSAPAGHWVPVPAAFADVMAAALAIAEASGGAFDPTAAPLVAAWGFGPNAARRPSAPVVAHDPARHDWRSLRLRREPDLLWQPGGVALDLGAIAKGFAVDAVCQALGAAGITSMLVDVGGELRGIGRKPDGTPWHVLMEGVEDEQTHGLPARIVQLDGMAVASSGDRWQRRGGGADRRTHLVDPRTGHCLPGEMAAVSVVAEDCMRADGWATALAVLGARDGPACAEALGLAARFLLRDGGTLREWLSPAFTRHLQPAPEQLPTTLARPQ